MPIVPATTLSSTRPDPAPARPGPAIDSIDLATVLRALVKEHRAGMFVNTRDDYECRGCGATGGTEVVHYAGCVWAAADAAMRGDDE